MTITNNTYTNTMIYNKTTKVTDAYLSPSVDVLCISAEQPFLTASLNNGPEGYKFDDPLNDW